MTMIILTLLRWASDTLFTFAEKNLETSNVYSFHAESLSGTNVFWVAFYSAKFHLGLAYFWMGLGFKFSALLRWLHQLILRP